MIDSQLASPRKARVQHQRGGNYPEFPAIEHLVQIAPIALSGGHIYSWQRWATSQQDVRPWARRATIRHSNLVELRSLQVTMPETIHLIETCLTLCFPGLSIKDAARKLLISLQDDNIAVTAAVKATSVRPNDSILDIRALVHFRSRLGPDDWQITRQLLCILCTKKAIEGVAQIAELNPSTHWSANRSDSAQCKRFRQGINSLNAVGGSRSAGLALVRRQLCLRALADSTGSSTFGWTRFSPQRDDGLMGEELCGIMSGTLQRQEASIPDLLTPYIRKTTCLNIIPVVKYQQGPLATGLGIPNFQARGILIKKPKGWDETTQDFCFLIISEDVRFDDDMELGGLLEEANRAKELFQADATYNQGDRALIDRWVQILKCHLPQDTPLEPVRSDDEAQQRRDAGGEVDIRDKAKYRVVG